MNRLGPSLFSLKCTSCINAFIRTIPRLLQRIVANRSLFYLLLLKKTRHDWNSRRFSGYVKAARVKARVSVVSEFVGMDERWFYVVIEKISIISSAVDVLHRICAGCQ